MFQESYILTESNSIIFQSNIDLIITGPLQSADHRSSALHNKISGFNGEILNLISKDNYRTFSYSLVDKKSIKQESTKELSIIPHYLKLLKELNVETKKILLDITSMSQALIFLSISILTKELKSKLFFVAYTQPNKYERKKLINLKESDEIYDLIGVIQGSSLPVPGFTKRSSKKEKLLIVSLGFDKKRFVAINESTNPQVIYPIFGFPSYKPGWDQIALRLNSDAILRYDLYDNAKNCIATSPFELYDTIKEVSRIYSDQYDIYLCPLGPRPHLLAMALFAAISNSYIIYDFPIEKKFGSSGSGKTYIYHLTNLLQ